jgi:ketosteroid isomerase-like protein
MTPQEFIKEYEQALSSQRWDKVAPLIHPDACVTFSDGSVHQGIEAIATAYQRNFGLIKNEQFVISDIHWIDMSHDLAIYIFKYRWQGMVGGQQASGQGRGTAVIKPDNGIWRLVAEHLGPAKL